MLKPKVNVEEFKKFGFKKCKGCSLLPIYYLCVAKDSKFLFVSPVMFDIQDWKNDDKRIHKEANCRYRDHRTSTDMLKGAWEE